MTIEKASSVFSFVLCVCSKFIDVLCLNCNPKISITPKKAKSRETAYSHAFSQRILKTGQIILRIVIVIVTGRYLSRMW